MRLEAVLQRVQEVDGQHVGFLREIAGAHPVGSAHGFVHLSQEATDFFDQVVLRGVELLAVGCPEIAFGCLDVVAGALLPTASLRPPRSPRGLTRASRRFKLTG